MLMMSLEILLLLMLSIFEVYGYVVRNTRMLGVLAIEAKKFDFEVKPEYGKTRSAKGCDSDYSILANMRAKGIDAPSSCNSGTCNTCTARFHVDGNCNVDEILAPEIEYSESEIEMMSRGLLLTCTTRCIGPGLSLELGAEDEV